MNATLVKQAGANNSMGTGRNVVVLCSLEISRMVCRNRSWSAMGSLLIMAAACTIFSAAWNSPSALTIFARRSRSASACLAIARFMLSGSETSFTSRAAMSCKKSMGSSFVYSSMMPAISVCKQLEAWLFE